ncbi:inositol 1,4,5-trisphosphate receptor-interacting protein [Gouania willdenowi]|uniref:Inositol 1,4,5-trisphosphate receptor-interacting protein n=1 Tax=Gouania willdenowi TaxID=441366 RepID=A0A8C5I2B5_GOUWI|nr:inositol 1,4,5-trisphosphate receptor-interacting protein [Gouania willdenowi]
MQGAIARVCMVVTAAILNHPLLFPPENSTLPEQDEELIARMQEHEELLKMEQAKLEKELSEIDSKQDESGSEQGYSWYIWSTLCFFIFFTIEMCRIDFADTEMQPVEDEDLLFNCGSFTPMTMLLEKDSLSNFCDKCTYSSTHENWRVKEFVEGFADDLLESLRSVCDREVDLEVGDFIGVGSMFESWKVCKPLTCDLIVPFWAPYPHSFQYRLWCSADSDVCPYMQGCGNIKVTRFEETTKEDCLCGSANLGDDMLCLLHDKNDSLTVGHTPDELLCCKNTHFLAKDRVMKWFQISVTKAWGRISHKYDFEVNFHNLDAAGALKIRFPSGKFILMNIIPVVQLENTDAYFVSHFPSDSDSYPDPHWPLSLAVYEKNLLKYFTKRLPQNACHLHVLQVVSFLHRKQVGLTGKSALTNYHLKTALLHLLFITRPDVWSFESMEHRLKDLLIFVLRSLREKRLNHALIGNSKVPKDFQLPENIRKAGPMNLFRSLVLQRDLYYGTVKHFEEMLRNASVLIQEYLPNVSNGSLRHILE